MPEMEKWEYECREFHMDHEFGACRVTDDPDGPLYDDDYGTVL